MKTDLKNRAMNIATGAMPTRSNLIVRDDFIYVGNVIIGIIYAILYLAEVIKEKK